MNLFGFLKNRLKFLPENKGKINIGDSLKAFYGKHRSGWLYALESLKDLHNKNGICFDGFIERTFNWHPEGIQIHKEPWIGVIHIPPNVPEWFQSEQSNDYIFKTDQWQKSYPFCKGLFTLSKYHKENLEKKLDIPINNLIFATQTPDLKWSWEKFEKNKNKKIVQVGWWLRKLHTIFQLSVSNYEKIFLKVNYLDVDSLIAYERELLKKKKIFDDNCYKTVRTLNFLNNSDYDKLLSENVIIINLYDTSANNLVTECIVRNTPILVNPLDAIVEYLGKDYPLYFNSIEEASEKADNMDLIYEAHKYLSDHPIKKKLTGEYFRKSFIESSIYMDL